MDTLSIVASRRLRASGNTIPLCYVFSSSSAWTAFTSCTRGNASWINYWAESYLDYSVVCEENVVSVHQDVWFAGPGHGSGCAWNIVMDLSLTELVTDLFLGSTESVDFLGVAVPLLAAV
jgi:hypothetical protein